MDLFDNKVDVDRYLSGINHKEPRIWKQFFLNFFNPLCNFSTSFVNNRIIAKDIVQEILFSIWQRSITFNSIPELNHYLYKSVYHNSLKYLRDRKRERFEEVEVESLKFDEGEIIEMALKEEIVRKLEKIIDQLPSRQQKVIKLSLSQMRNIDIADEMKISINTVKKLKKNAYSTIRIHIERDLFLLFLFLLEY